MPAQQSIKISRKEAQEIHRQLGEVCHPFPSVGLYSLHMQYKEHHPVLSVASFGFYIRVIKRNQLTPLLIREVVDIIVSAPDNDMGPSIDITFNEESISNEDDYIKALELILHVSVLLHHKIADECNRLLVTDTPDTPPIAQFEVKVKEVAEEPGYLEIASIVGVTPKELPVIYMVSSEPKVFRKDTGKKDGLILNIGTEYIHFKQGDRFKMEDVVQLLITVETSNKRLKEIGTQTNSFDLSKFLL